eukprot:12562997-Alexandrium_andersonii.AAC.1
MRAFSTELNFRGARCVVVLALRVLQRVPLTEEDNDVGEATPVFCRATELGRWRGVRPARDEATGCVWSIIEQCVRR